MSPSKNALIYAVAAATALAFTVGLLALQGCQLFTPSRADLQAYCVADPDMQAAAKEAGVPVEVLCAKLIKEAEEASEKTQACAGDSGTCELR